MPWASASVACVYRRRCQSICKAAVSTPSGWQGYHNSLPAPTLQHSKDWIHKVTWGWKKERNRGTLSLLERSCRNVSDKDGTRVPIWLLRKRWMKGCKKNNLMNIRAYNPWTLVRRLLSRDEQSISCHFFYLWLGKIRKKITKQWLLLLCFTFKAGVCS